MHKLWSFQLAKQKDQNDTYDYSLVYITMKTGLKEFSVESQSWYRFSYETRLYNKF